MRKGEEEKKAENFYLRATSRSLALIRFNKPIRYKNPPFTRFTWKTGTSGLFPLPPSPPLPLQSATTIVDSRAMIDAKIPVEITDGEGMINEPRDFLDLPSPSCLQPCFNFVIRTSTLVRTIVDCLSVCLFICLV